MPQISQIALGGKSTFIYHSAYNDRMKMEVSNFSVGNLCRRSKKRVPVKITYADLETRKKWYPILIQSDDLVYCTIEIEAKVAYDNRLEVPCDMTKWQEKYDKNRVKWLKREEQGECTAADFPEE